jgi:hypothetical protein
MLMSSGFDSPIKDLYTLPFLPSFSTRFLEKSIFVTLAPNISAPLSDTILSTIVSITSL